MDKKTVVICVVTNLLAKSFFKEGSKNKAELAE